MSNNIIIKEGRKTYQINPRTGEKARVLSPQKYTKKGRMTFGSRKTGRIILQTGRE